MDKIIINGINVVDCEQLVNFQEDFAKQVELYCKVHKKPCFAIDCHFKELIRTRENAQLKSRLEKFR